MKGIEPSSVAWKATALPLSYTRVAGKLPLLPKPAKLFLVWRRGPGGIRGLGLHFSALALATSHMKIFAFAFSVGALTISPLRADLTLVQSVEGAGPAPTSMTIKIKGEKARIEVTPQVTTIIDSRTGDMLNLMNDDKKSVRISADKARAAAEMAVAPESKNQPTTKPQLKATGRKETINGYETEEYTCDAPAFKATYWIATNYPNAAAIVRQLQAMTPQAWNVSGKGLPDYRDFPGVPVRSRVDLGGKQITSTLTSLKQDPLTDAEFQPPAGFEEMKMPDLGALLGGKVKHARPTPAPKP